MVAEEPAAQPVPTAARTPSTEPITPTTSPQPPTEISSERQKPTESITATEQTEQPFTETTAEEIRRPDTLIVAESSDADTLDPVHAHNAVSGEVIFNIYENLIAYEGSQVDRFVPLLASEVPSIENGLIRTESDDTTYYVFPIRPNVTFHDGSPLTPGDVAYSFRRLMIHSHPESPAWILLEDLLGVQDIEELAKKMGDEQACEMAKESVTVQGNHVVFKLPHPSASFLARIAQSASWGAIQSRNFVVANGGWDEDCATWRGFYSVEKAKLPLHNQALGTGPFRLERWTLGEEIVLARNENYWRERARLAEAVIKIIPEFERRKLLLEQGDADIVSIPLQFVPQMVGTPGVRVIRNLPTLESETAFFSYSLDTQDNPYIGSGQLDGNGISPDFFTDLNTRKAFNYSFDWKTYTEQIRGSEAKQSYGPIPQSLSSFINVEGPHYSYDPQKAGEYFQRAWSGQLWEKGFKMMVIYYGNSDTHKHAAQILKENIEKMNPKFQIEARGEPWSVFWEDCRANRIPLFIIAQRGEFPDPHRFSITYEQNWSEMAPYHELMRQASRELDLTVRSQFYYQLQHRAYEDAINIFLVDVLSHHWERAWVDGWSYNPAWPGQNFYTLTKKVNADVHPDLFVALPEIVIEQW